MKKIIHVVDHAGELKCDAPTCDYVAPAGLYVFGAHLIGTPCPKCGASLLTKQDYDIMTKIKAGVDFINRLGAKLGLGTEEPPTKGDGTCSVSVSPVNGKIEIKVGDDA